MIRLRKGSESLEGAVGSNLFWLLITVTSSFDFFPVLWQTNSQATVFRGPVFFDAELLDAESDDINVDINQFFMPTLRGLIGSSKGGIMMHFYSRTSK